MTNKNYIMAIDQGTTNTKVALFSREGSLEYFASKEHTQIYPKPGWVEQDPIEIWQNVKACIKEVIKISNVNVNRIDSIGVTNQRESLVVWDKETGTPLHNVIVWQDRRSSKLVDNLKKEYADLIKEKTGLVPDAYFTGPKIMWLIQNVESIKDKIGAGKALLGTIDSWIIWNLTKGAQDSLTPDMRGAYVTDYSNASRTMLFSIDSLSWDPELLEIEGRVPIKSLPLPRPSSEKQAYGFTGEEVARIFDSVKLPVTGDIGDQQGALFGQGCYEDGDIKSTYGTGNFILINTKDKKIRSKANLLTTVFYSLEEGKAEYALEGSIFITGAAVQWLKDGLKLFQSLEEIEKLGEQISDTGGVYFVPAFAGLGAPYWDQYARGVLVGITGVTGKPQIARAALESIAYLNRDIIEVMAKDTGKNIKEIRVDGGGSKNNFLMQLQADITGIRINRPYVLETTAQGAAYLAGLATGFWQTLEELKLNWKLDKAFYPEMDFDQREKLYAGWKAALKRSMGWALDVPWAYGL
ncbi:MAG: glycerol kinase GlpK [Nitrososphaeria archaeon]|nr:glycerol kinase GlpK [Conexivisphaerales archaeon]